MLFKKIRLPIWLSDRLARPLVAEQVTGGIVFPTERKDENIRRIGNGVSAGVRRNDGKPIRDSGLIRNFRQVVAIAPMASQITDDPRKVIYGGVYIRHFGHFLLETLCRLWCARDYPDHALAFSVTGDFDTATVLPKWQTDLIARLCGPRQIVFVANPTRFSEVVIATSGYRIPDRFHSAYAAQLAQCGLPYSPRSGAWIWLSRSRVEPDFGLLNSEVLETHLARAGWTISYPETLSIADQIAQLAHAERIGGEEGSALHMVIWLENAQALRVDILGRWSKHDEVKGNYSLIAARKQLRQVEHLMRQEKIVRQVRGKNARLALNFTEHLDALAVPVPPLPALLEPDAFGAWLAAQAAGRPLVQIGGEVAFVSLPHPAKTLIATDSGLDPRAIRAAGVQLVEMTPDQAVTHFPDLFKNAVLFLPASDSLSDETLRGIAKIASVVIVRSDAQTTQRMARLMPDAQIAAVSLHPNWATVAIAKAEA